MRSGAVDNAAKETELLSLLRREMNGAVVESMREKGLEYKLSYGVTLADIKNISREFAPDHEFAKNIYGSDTRELRLAAFHIADPGKITPGELPFWASGIDNTEIASVAALTLFSKSVTVEDIIFNFFGSGGPLLKYTALMTAAANLMHTKNSPQWAPDRLLGIIRTDKTANPEKWPGFLASALSSLLDRLEAEASDLL